MKPVTFGGQQLSDSVSERIVTKSESRQNDLGVVANNYCGLINVLMSFIHIWGCEIFIYILVPWTSPTAHGLKKGQKTLTIFGGCPTIESLL